MASEIDICNLAIANLSHDVEVTAITPPDGSREAAYCARFYPVARDATLEMHDWGFATRRSALTLSGTAPNGWDYQYSYPNEIIRPLQIYADGVDPQVKPQGEPFIVESDETYGTVILTNVETAWLRYIVRVTNTARFTPSFVQALGWMLASYLAGPLMQDRDLAVYCEKRAYQMTGRAGMCDANAQKSAVQGAINRRYPIGLPRGASWADQSDLYDE